jgi:hypothetical protein
MVAQIVTQHRELTMGMIIQDVCPRCMSPKYKKKVTFTTANRTINVRTVAVSMSIASSST